MARRWLTGWPKRSSPFFPSSQARSNSSREIPVNGLRPDDARLRIHRRKGRDEPGQARERSAHPEQLVAEPLGNQDAVHPFRRVGGPPAEDARAAVEGAEDVPQRLDLAPVGGDRQFPPRGGIPDRELQDPVLVGALAGGDGGPQDGREHRLLRDDGPPRRARLQRRERRQPAPFHQPVEDHPIGGVQPDEQHRAGGPRQRPHRGLRLQRFGRGLRVGLPLQAGERQAGGGRGFSQTLLPLGAAGGIAQLLQPERQARFEQGPPKKVLRMPRSQARPRGHGAEMTGREPARGLGRVGDRHVFAGVEGPLGAEGEFPGLQRLDPGPRPDPVHPRGGLHEGAVLLDPPVPVRAGPDETEPQHAPGQGGGGEDDPERLLHRAHCSIRKTGLNIMEDSPA